MIELDKDKDFVQDKDSKPNLDECPNLQCQLLAEVVTPMVPFKNYNLFWRLLLPAIGYNPFSTCTCSSVCPVWFSFTMKSDPVSKK